MAEIPEMNPEMNPNPKNSPPTPRSPFGQLEGFVSEIAPSSPTTQLLRECVSAKRNIAQIREEIQQLQQQIHLDQLQIQLKNQELQAGIIQLQGVTQQLRDSPTFLKTCWSEYRYAIKYGNIDSKIHVHVSTPAEHVSCVQDNPHPFRSIRFLKSDVSEDATQKRRNILSEEERVIKREKKNARHDVSRKNRAIQQQQQGDEED